MPDCDGVQARRAGRADVAERRAPFACLPRSDDLGIGTGHEQSGLVEQRRRVTRRRARPGGGGRSRRYMDGIECGLGAREREPGQGIAEVVQAAAANRDLAGPGDSPLVVERGHPPSGRRDETDARSAGKREAGGARNGVERRTRGDRGEAGRLEPSRIRAEGGMIFRHALHVRRQCRPPSESTMTTTTKIASTSSATFHGLFGYSPRIAPVTPFITHWNARVP